LPRASPGRSALRIRTPPAPRDAAQRPPDLATRLNLLAQLNLTDVTDRIRSATETLYQELIDGEATAFGAK
jgi:hypothetical protein